MAFMGNTNHPVLLRTNQQRKDKKVSEKLDDSATGEGGPDASELSRARRVRDAERGWKDRVIERVKPQAYKAGPLACI